ncbi:MAG: mannose-1-phosphate guanylyltransferase [Anaerolineaceae bacterium]
MTDHFFAVIMAGGGGTRLWPLSRKIKPKQLLKIGTDKSLFQMAVDRLEGLFPPERIFIVTVAEQAVLLQAQCPQIPRDNYLIEPLPRGTASVVGMAAVALQQLDPQAIMAVLTADHFIQNIIGFQKLLRAGCQAAEEGYLVTLGIKPTFPATGYGYIQRGKKLGTFTGQDCYEVLRFIEKPAEPQAVKMLASGDHDWNSGMFIWRVDRILEEMARLMPELTGSLETIRAAWKGAQPKAVIEQIWPGINPETIDYGIMEHALKVASIPAIDLGWNDVGSWDSLFEVLPADENGNIILAKNYQGIETRDSLVVSEQGKKLITLIGAENLIVVETDDAILICNRDQTQKVKDLVNLLKDTDHNDYL